jgi:two-component system cell cycle sensor histidine kinase/response regulator CckA
MEPETILVVDDDATARAFCCSVLSHDGYRVLPAGSGQEALDICMNGERIDMALVDVMMPEMTGIELLKRLETLQRTPKVALISGYTPEEVASLIGDDGSSYRIFWKPFDIRIFLQMIRNVLDAPQREIASYARP